MKKKEFKNVTIIYDETKVNENLCKKKKLYMNLVSVLLGLVIIALAFASSFVLISKAVIIESLLKIIVMYVVVAGSAYFTHWLVYHKTTKTFLFMDQIFKVKDISAGWYYDRILFGVECSDNTVYYSTERFVSKIQNNVTVIDKSDRGKTINVYIDITDDDKTEITIENKY